MDKYEEELINLKNTQNNLSKSMDAINSTLEKIEVAIEKQNDISTDIRLLREQIKGHLEKYDEGSKRQNIRIENLEKNQARVAWIIVTTVMVALLGIVITK